MATERQLASILACLERLEGKVDALDARLKQFSAVSGLDETSVANGKKNTAINRCIDLLYTDAIASMADNAKELMPQKKPTTVTEVHTQSESKVPEILRQNRVKGAKLPQVVNLAGQQQEKNSSNLQSESLRRSARNVNKRPPNYSQGVPSKNGKRTKNDKLKKGSPKEVASTVLFQKQAQEAIQIDSSQQTRSESRASGDEQLKVTVATIVASTSYAAHQDGKTERKGVTNNVSPPMESTASSLGETQVKPKLAVTGTSSCAPSHIIANWPGVADRRNLWEMRIKSN